MTVDSTLSLQARRNVPVRYDRDLLNQTLAAMERISEIRQRRERRLYQARMKGNRRRQLEEDRKLVRENAHLLPPRERQGLDELLDEGVVTEPTLAIYGMSDEEPDEEVESAEDDEGEHSILIERAAQEKEDEAIRKAREAKPKQANEKRKGRRVIVGHGPEKMDVDT